MAATILCGAAFAAPAAPATPPPEVFYSFSDLVRLTSSMDGAAVAPVFAGVVYDMESASAGASRAPDDGPLQLGQVEGGQALRVGAPGAPAQASAPREARYAFSVSTPPQGWLLLLSGLAAAGWVARRRLRYPVHG
jgi:hypothetical protein